MSDKRRAAVPDLMAALEESLRDARLLSQLRKDKAENVQLTLF